MPITTDTLRQVENAMSRLAQCIAALRANAQKQETTIGCYSLNGKYNSAVKRASMDLTRALADLRRVR